jgi:hypothetical protein
MVAATKYQGVEGDMTTAKTLGEALEKARQLHGDISMCVGCETWLDCVDEGGILFYNAQPVRGDLRSTHIVVIVGEDTGNA